MATEYIGESAIIKLMIVEAALIYPTYEDLTAVPVAEIDSGKNILVAEDNKVYAFDETATDGDYAPDDQADNTGFWILTSGAMSFDSFQKVEAYVVLESLNQSFLKFSSIPQEGFKDMVVIDDYTRRLIIEDSESAEFEPGDYILEIHKYLADTRFDSGYKKEKQKIDLWTFKDSIR